MERRQRQRTRMDVALWNARAAFTDILFARDWDSAELFSAGLKVVWGAWVLGPAQTFASGAGFSRMASVAPEWLWGLVILTAGAAHLVALATGSLKHRRRGALTGAWIWAAVSFLLWEGNPSGTGWITYGGLALMAGWAYWRLGGRASA